MTVKTEKEKCSEQPLLDVVSIKILGPGDSMRGFFKVRPYVPIYEVMTAYTRNIGQDIRTLRFRYEGTPITETDTALSLGMSNNINVVDVYQSQSGGAFGTNYLFVST